MREIVTSEEDFEFSPRKESATGSRFFSSSFPPPPRPPAVACACIMHAYATAPREKCLGSRERARAAGGGMPPSLSPRRLQLPRLDIRCAGVPRYGNPDARNFADGSLVSRAC